MANILVRPPWQGRENDITDIRAFQNRREFVKTLGLGAIGLVTAPSIESCADTAPAQSGELGGADVPSGPLDTIPENAPRDGYPAAANPKYEVAERGLTERVSASSYNNYYEFDGQSKEVWHLTGKYEPFPGEVEVSGLVEKNFKVDLADLINSMDLEERIYRFRCVEAWSMTVPWTGFPLSKLIERCKPLSKATHVRFVSAVKKKQMPGVRNQPWYEWPYYEALRIDEAVNDVAFVVTGMYGEPLTKQNGAPIRLALPWKYGYKGPKAVAKIEFVDKEPKTFWNDLAPKEYSFISNVNPNVPHPRWSQASERYIQNLDNVRRIPTQMFNGYTEFVGDMYPDEPRG